MRPYVASPTFRAGFAPFTGHAALVTHAAKPAGVTCQPPLAIALIDTGTDNLVAAVLDDGAPAEPPP